MGRGWKEGGKRVGLNGGNNNSTNEVDTNISKCISTYLVFNQKKTSFFLDTSATKTATPH